MHIKYEVCSFNRFNAQTGLIDRPATQIDRQTSQENTISAIRSVHLAQMTKKYVSSESGCDRYTHTHPHTHTQTDRNFCDS